MREELEGALAQIEKAIVGKRAAIETILTAILADGHVLLDDVPGVGKTTLAVAFSRALGLSCQRVQFSPDVLPSDLLGFSMYDQNTGEFVYRPGALVGANLVLGDEINRASSKTQSALLEAMEERQVTVDGKTYPLETPFCVIATENRVGAAGTQPLPYAQMDRFLVRLSLGYPDAQAQMKLLRSRLTDNPLLQVEPALSRERILEMRRDVRQVTVRDSLLDYITRLTMASREREEVEVGISPRGALFLCRMAQARAFVENRDYVTGGDVQAVFHDVCAHRILLKKDAETTEARLLSELLKSERSPDHWGLTRGWRKAETEG